MKKILVIGSINYDINISVENIPEKGSNILAKSVEYVLGGKGSNLALACHKLGLDVSLYGKIGYDEEGKFLINSLKQHKMNTDNIVLVDNFTTGKAYICIDKESNNFIIVDKGANFSFDKYDEEKINELIKDYDMILIQLEINLDMVEKIIKISKKHNKKLIIDAGPIVEIDYRIFKGAFIVSPNETELENLVGRKLANFDEIKSACEELYQTGIENIIVKLGSRGSFYYTNGIEYFQRAYKVKSVDSTAAGDSFMAGLALGLSEGKDIIEAMDIGSKCGAIATTKVGASASLPTREALDNFGRLYEID